MEIVQPLLAHNEWRVQDQDEDLTDGGWVGGGMPEESTRT